MTRGGVYWKTSDGTETAVAPTSSAGFATWSIQCHRIVGSGGIDVSDMGSITTEADTPAPVVTTTGPNRLILSAWFASTDLGPGALPATALVEDFGGGREWVGSSHVVQAAAGASTPLALTAASGTRRGVTLAFAP